MDSGEAVSDFTIRPVAETADTVTLSRADYEALQRELAKLFGAIRELRDELDEEAIAAQRDEE